MSAHVPSLRVCHFSADERRTLQSVNPGTAANSLQGGCDKSAGGSSHNQHLRFVSSSTGVYAAGTAGDALDREWTVWADNKSSHAMSSEDFDLEYASRRDISTWADFWGFWNDVKDGRVELGDGAILCMFVRGVKPTWEDSEAHGKWVVLTDKRETLSRLLLLLQALLDGQNTNMRHVCGIQLSMRPQRDCLAIWNTKGGHSSFIKTMRSHIITSARLGNNHKVNYFIIRSAAANSLGKVVSSSFSSGNTSTATSANNSLSLSEHDAVRASTAAGVGGRYAERGGLGGRGGGGGGGKGEQRKCCPGKFSPNCAL